MRNVGNIDRVLRVVVGVALIALVFVGPQSLWGLIGIIPILTAFVGVCPAYRLFGIRTCPIGRQATQS
ncbi:MAG: DUF2892 domain-containing protein [Alphaproteobacteria bacterium]|nr:DUF2892 domain-containing protein [Alphaproteobacteria bacterium]